MIEVQGDLDGGVPKTAPAPVGTSPGWNATMWWVRTSTCGWRRSCRRRAGSTAGHTVIASKRGGCDAPPRGHSLRSRIQGRRNIQGTPAEWAV